MESEKPGLHSECVSDLFRAVFAGAARIQHVAWCVIDRDLGDRFAIEIGDNTFINMNVVMLDGANIRIGNNVLVGPSAQFYTASHSLDHLSRRKWETFCLPITVEDDVWIGGNSVINQGVTIGARSVIAANSVVNSDVPPDCLYGGTPAKLIRHLNTEQQSD